jgi:hypothetical protein
MHGWEARVPYDLLVEAQRTEENLDIARYADRMVVAVEDAWRAASENMGDVAARAAMRGVNAAKTANPIPKYHTGQMVVLKKMHLNRGEHKEQSRVWLGPYEVVGKGSEVNYWIDKAGVLDLVHVDRMKKYVDGRPLPTLAPRGEADLTVAMEEDAELEPRTAEQQIADQIAGQLEREEEPDEEVIRAEEERNNVYEVEAILGKRSVPSTSRLNGGKVTQYLIKWKNFTDEENTWEHEGNLAGSRELIKTFDDTARDKRAIARAEQKQHGDAAR